jgi:hypothetical protein
MSIVRKLIQTNVGADNDGDHDVSIKRLVVEVEDIGTSCVISCTLCASLITVS